MGADVGELLYQDVEHLDIGADDGTFGACAVCLVLRGDDRNGHFTCLQEQQLGMVLPQIDTLEGGVQQTLQMECLACCPLIEQYGRVVD